jgi:hypothetical protein
MNLLQYLLKQTQLWAFVFPQERSLQRAIALAFGILCGVGKRTLTRAISFQGNTHKDWSADYKVFSRSAWEARALFHPILQQAIQEQKLERIVLSVDDTRVWRNGKHVPQTQWHRSPGTMPSNQSALGTPVSASQFSAAAPCRMGQVPRAPFRCAEMAPVVKNRAAKPATPDAKVSQAEARKDLSGVVAWSGSAPTSQSHGHVKNNSPW